MKQCNALLALAVFTFCATSSGCTAKEDKRVVDPASPQATNSPTGTPVANREITTAEVHDAICGHVLKEVGHCGNYVSIDGRYVPLEWPALGAMEYCKAGEKGAKVEITGSMKDGKFVATSYRKVE